MAIIFLFSVVNFILKKKRNKICIHHISMYLCSMYSKELLKGTLSAIVLKLLAVNGKMYGYQITQIVKQLSDDKILLKEGSLYPALHKLKDDGLIEVQTENIGKRVRHYYSLTPKGVKIKQEKEAELKDFISTINKIITS
jgi:PadR family transcriptional regulator, regulatory protein PadR